MRDDDLDLDLDYEPGTPAKPAKPVKPTPAAKAAAATDPKPALSAGAKAPSLLARAKNYVKRPQFNGRTFLILLLALLALVILGENAAPVRFYLLGLALELPKALAFLIHVAAGAALMWWWLHKPSKSAEGGK